MILRLFSGVASALSFLCLAAHAITIDAPSVATTRVDEAITFSIANHHPIQLSGTLDPTDTVTLTVGSGSLSLAQTTNLTFPTGDGTADPTVAFRGSLADVNAALDGLSFVPATGVASRVLCTVSVGGTQAANASFHLAVNAVLDVEVARDAILAGVTTIHSGVQPGRLIAYGPEAYDINFIPGSSTQAMIAVASLGQGRIVAVPDSQILDMGRYGADSGTFYKNAIAWTTGSAALTVNIVTYDSNTATWLGGEGYTNVTSTNEAGLAAGLAGADLFIGGWIGTNEPSANLEALRDFAAAGGGLMIADYGVGYNWWWGKPIHDAPGNLLLREAGIGFTDGNGWETGTIDASNRAAGQINATTVLAMLDDPASYPQADLDRGGSLLGEIYNVLQPNDPLMAAFNAGFEAAINGINPTPATPVSDPFEQSLLWREQMVIEDLPPAQVTAHRTAEDVFGAIPPGAPRVTKEVPIDPTRCRWHSTGLYAAPGDLVTVTVPAGAVGQGYKIRVSGHTDNLGGKPSWKRMPKVSRSFDVDASTVQVANAFGGAIYFDVGRTAPGGASFSITIANALEAPYFVLGQTTNTDWTNGIRDNPAPFAELVCERLAISLPSDQIRFLENPHEVVTYWNNTVAWQDYVGAFENLRDCAERFNVDVQISVGALHAGYPMMGPTGTGPDIVNLAKLEASGTWGWFHELGHEMQRRPDKSWGWVNPYTFSGDVEVTVNIFANAALERGAPCTGTGNWGYSAHSDEVMRRALTSVAAGGTFDSKDGYPFYFQLADAFGWDTYRAVFQTYHADQLNNPSALPQDNAAKKDQWLVRWSQVTGMSLKMFMVDQWGLTVSASALSQVAGLPDWLPAFGGLSKASVPAGGWLTVDLDAELLSYDGVAAMGSIQQPQNGTLLDNGDGTWSYIPNAGFSGVDSFTYHVLSSTGHAIPTEVRVQVLETGVLSESWFGIGGTALSDLITDPRYPDSPDQIRLLNSFDTGSGLANDYGSRLRGWLVPQVTGSYTFWVASDENGELHLSTDADPANTALIAHVPGWTSYKQWNKFAEQQSAPVTLLAGNCYYLEGLVKEGGGGDHLAVAWSGPGITQEVIPGTVLHPFHESRDTDADQLSDTWEVQQFGNLTQNGLLDSDGDTLNHATEQAFALSGTKLDVLSLEVPIIGNELEVRFRRPLDFHLKRLHYILQSTADLGTWNDHPALPHTTTPAGDGLSEWVTCRVARPATGSFFVRIKAVVLP